MDDEDQKIQSSYIGDGVYAEFDGFSLRLYTQSGSNIWMEQAEWAKLRKFMTEKETMK